MAIANTNEVKFLYAAKAANASTGAGVISFAEDTRQILVGTGSDAAVAFAGNVKNVTFVDGVLTIERNNAEAITLNFNNVAGAKETMAVFTALEKLISDEADARSQGDTALENKITNIVKDGGTIDTKVAVEAKAREDADKAINDKIGTVADGSTLVGMIADAKAAAIAAGTIVTEESDFITVEKTGEEGGTQTYTIKTSDIAKASDLAKTDASLALEIQNRGTAIEDAIKALDSSKSDSSEDNHVSVAVEITDGMLTKVEVGTSDIASAQTLANHEADAVKHITAKERTDWNTAKQRIDTFLADADMTANAVDTLKELQEYMVSDGSAATELVNRVDALETKATDASNKIANLDSSYKAADTQIRADYAAADASVLKDAKAYADQQATAAKNAVSAEGDAYVTASASGGKVTVNATASTIASLGKADTAVQSVTEGTTNGTISVDNKNVAVHGLGSAAYTDATAYDAAGTATTKADAALNAAKAYADAIKVNGQSQSGQAITITGADIKVGGDDTGIADTTLAAQIATMKNDIQTAQKAGVQSIAVASDSSAFAAVDKSTGAVSFSVKTVALDGLTDSSANGLVDAKTVKAYVDAAESRATLKWIVA